MPKFKSRRPWSPADDRLLIDVGGMANAENIFEKAAVWRWALSATTWGVININADFGVLAEIKSQIPSVRVITNDKES